MHTEGQKEHPTVMALLQETAMALKESSSSARLDAELLLGHVLGRSRVQLYGDPKSKVRPEIVARFSMLVRERRQGRPVAQLLGVREFWSLDLTVTADTLIPRPETELLVERALLRISAELPTDVLDLGTGSGAIALAIATERPHAQVYATDISEPALAVARYNARSLGIDQVEFHFGDWLSAAQGLRFSTIVSNPPYVTDKEWVLRGPELNYEPQLALRGGRDGLLAIRRIVERAPDFLHPGGWLLIEHGFRQGPAVAGLFQEAGFAAITTYRDLPGHPRITEGRLE
jgi:release factor glutamine methyltransferase